MGFTETSGDNRPCCEMADPLFDRETRKINESWREQTHRYAQAVLKAHPEWLSKEDFVPGEPQSAEPDEPDPIKVQEMIAEKKEQIETLCSELESLQAINGPFTAQKIARSIAKAYGYTLKELVSSRRNHHLARARQHAMWEIRRNTTLSLPHIGKILGGRDHTTIIHGLRQHEKRMANGEIAA